MPDTHRKSLVSPVHLRFRSPPLACSLKGISCLTKSCFRIHRFLAVPQDGFGRRFPRFRVGLAKWQKMTNFIKSSRICRIYHQRPREVPENKARLAVTGSSGEPGHGLPANFYRPWSYPQAWPPVGRNRPLRSTCIFFFTSGGFFFIISGKLAYRRSSCQPR